MTAADKGSFLSVDFDPGFVDYGTLMARVKIALKSFSRNEKVSEFL